MTNTHIDKEAREAILFIATMFDNQHGTTTQAELMRTLTPQPAEPNVMPQPSEQAKGAEDKAADIQASKDPVVQEAWSKIHHAYTLKAVDQIGFPECTRRVAIAIYTALESERAKHNQLRLSNERMREAGKACVDASHLRTHGFEEGDISDMDFSKMLPAIMALAAALTAESGTEGKG